MSANSFPPSKTAPDAVSAKHLRPTSQVNHVFDMLSAVKRLGVTALIAMYTLLLMWNSMDRTYTWAAVQSASFANHSDDSVSSVSINKPRTVNAPHQLNRRILESQFVVEPPVVASWIVLTSETLHQMQDLLPAGTDTWQTTGRAPPRSL